MKHWSRDISLTKRVLLIPLVTVVLMSACLISVAVWVIHDSYENRVSHIIDLTVQESSRYVSAELRNMVALVHYSLLDGRLQSALSSDLDGDIANYIAAQDTIISILSQLKVQSNFIESAALTAQGRLFSDGLHQVSYETAPLLEAARGSRLSYWAAAPVLNERSSRQVLPVVMRVPTGDFSSKNEAYILINLDVSTLVSYLHSLEQTLQCRLILHSGDSVLYDADGIFDSIDKDDPLVHDTVLDINGWSLCCVMDRALLYADRNEAFTRMALASVLLAALGLLLSYQVARSILRPVQSLTRAAGLVAQGDYTVRTNVTGGDELGTLGRVFNTMTERISQDIHALEEKNREIASIEQSKRLAEMRTLQAQINPHFLYNTLDSIYWYSLSDRSQEIGVIIEKLSDMLRIGLSRGSEYIPVEQELRHVTDYLTIQKIIFGEKFDYEIETQGLSGQTVLKILLQPLAENSLTHGFENLERGGHIRVCAAAEDGALRFSVTDNGCGFAMAAPDEANEYSGFALKNIRQRLAAHYGERASLQIRSEPYEETTVEILIREGGEALC